MPYADKEKQKAYVRDWAREYQALKSTNMTFLAKIREFPEYKQLSTQEQLELDRKLLEMLLNFDKQLAQLMEQKLEEATQLVNLNYGELIRRVQEKPEWRQKTLQIVREIQR